MAKGVLHVPQYIGLIRITSLFKLDDLKYLYNIYCEEIGSRKRTDLGLCKVS